MGTPVPFLGHLGGIACVAGTAALAAALPGFWAYDGRGAVARRSDMRPRA